MVKKEKSAIILVLIINIILLGAVYFLGISDWAALFLGLLIMLCLFFTILDLNGKNKKILRVYSKKNSLLYIFLSRKITFLSVVIAIFSSAFLSVILLLSLKGIQVSIASIFQLYSTHNFWPLFIVFLINISCSFLAYKVISVDKRKSDLFDKNLNGDLVNYGRGMIKLVYSAIIISIFLSTIFSTLDVYQYKTEENSLGINNVFSVTKEESERIMHKTDHNKYGRRIINAHLLSDNFKGLFFNFFFKKILEIQNILFLYLVFFVINFMRLFIFSWGLSLLNQNAYMMNIYFLNRKDN